MRRYNQIACGLLVTLLHHAGWAQNDASQVLTEQGIFWQAQQDSQRAAQAWNKLLLISPENPQALYGLGIIELYVKKPEAARAYLERLKQAQPNHPLVTQLEQDILLSSDENRALLEEARQAIASDDSEVALAKYRQALGGRSPVGEVGRAYYSVLGYTPGGLSEAIAGLQHLVGQSPEDSGLQLALARHLARNESTRLEGIRRLARLSARSDIGSEATESWRGALTWLGPPQPDARPLFTEYLAKHPDDADIRAQLQQGVAMGQGQTSVRGAAVPRPDPLRKRTDAAMKLVESGDTTRARAEFEAILAKRPNDSEALGGMGVLAMRDGNWQQAHEYLTRARRGNAAWQPSLSKAQYWIDVEKARALYQAGKTDEARKLLNQAVKLAPKESAANVLLADIKLDEGKTAEAVQDYRAALQRRPDDIQAVTGLSKAARSSGDDEGARKLLENALAKNPDNPWLRYQLAELYQDAGREQEARGLIDGLLVTHPNDPVALYASALFSASKQQWIEARDKLERIPAAQRTFPMNQLHAMVTRRSQIDEAVSLAHGGRKAEVLAWLGQIEADSANDFDMLSAVARAYVDIGEPARGLALLRPLREQGQARSVDASIAYVGLLLASDQDVEASIVLRQLQGKNLTVSQRRMLAELSDTYQIRQADLLTERGDLAAAHDTLAPVLERRPNDLAARGTLARIYAASGQGDKALEIYEALLRSDPDNPDLHLGLAQISQQLREYRQAEREAEIAVSLAPEDVKVLTAAARIYRLSGKSGDAAKLLERAVALESGSAKTAAAQLAARPSEPAPSTLFAGAAGQRAAPASATSRSSMPVASGPAHSPGTAARGGTPREAGGGALIAPETMTSLNAEVALSPDSSRMQPAAIQPASSPAAAPQQPQDRAQAASMAMAGSPSLASSGLQRAAAEVDPPVDTSASLSSASAAARELDEVYQERSTQVRIGTEVRSRNGDEGTSSLVETQVPIQVDFPVGNDRMSVRATPVVLSAGSIGEGWTSGGPANLLPYSPYAVNDERQRGIGLSLGYQTRGMELDAGVTPLGFQEVDFTGGALFNGTLGKAGTASYSLDISRRPVTDSVLSFAGRRQDDLGLEWGGVSATGARLTLSKDFGSGGIYGSAAWHSLNGNNVASNHRTEINTGAYSRVINKEDAKFMVGVNLNATFFDKNQSYFTYGHGGYFSPEHFYALSMPLTWAQRTGRFSYRIDGAVGWQHFTQADAPVFPNNSDLQAYAEQLAGTGSLFGDGYYRGSSKTGIGYNLKASAEHRLNSNLVLGATLGANNADDYRQWMGGLYLRYYFYPQRGLLDLPVEPYRSPYGNTYGR